VTANISVSANVDSLLLQNADLESTVVHALKEQIKHLQLNLEQQQHTIQHVPSNVSESESAKDEKDSAKHDLEKAMQVITFSARALKGALSKRGDEMLEKRSEEVVQVLDDFISKQRDMRCRDDAFAKGGSMTLRHMRQSVSLADSLSNLLISDIARGHSSNFEEQIASLEEEAAALRLELEECREDLKRDEDIFAEKVRDLKKCRKQLKDTEHENNDLKSKVEHLTKQVAKLTSPKFVVVQGIGNSDRHEEMDLALEDGNLDISLAVMATEPDISQLMEDLEVIAKEKDVLLADNLEVSKTVITQKHDFLESQQKLREQLRSLEVSIQSKEKLIHELQESEMQTKEMAAKYEIRAGQGSLLYHHYYLHTVIWSTLDNYISGT
jgi:hypothetical protein